MKEQLKECFERIGVHALISYVSPRVTPSVNVLRDDVGEFFDIECSRQSPPRVLDADAEDRHLLLGFGERWFEQSVFLCGHDERFWFAAAIPESAHATYIAAAKDALKPKAVWDAIRERGVRPEDRNLRKTAAFVRQGEWFFIPRPGLTLPAGEVSRNEPLRRGEGKPHVCDFHHRTADVELYVNQWYPDGLTWDRVRQLSPNERHDRWTRIMRNGRIHVRGAVRHADHATVFLRSWHEVAMNTEGEARGMRMAALSRVQFPVLRFRD